MPPFSVKGQLYHTALRIFKSDFSLANSFMTSLETPHGLESPSLQTTRVNEPLFQLSQPLLQPQGFPLIHAQFSLPIQKYSWNKHKMVLQKPFLSGEHIFFFFFFFFFFLSIENPPTSVCLTSCSTKNQSSFCSTSGVDAQSVACPFISQMFRLQLCMLYSPLGNYLEDHLTKLEVFRGDEDWDSMW